MNPSAYVALVGRDYVESSDNLDDLLALLAETVDPTVPEDVAVWHGGRVLVVVRSDGSWLWVRPEYQPEAAA
jgi:hypothetical protein